MVEIKLTKNELRNQQLRLGQLRKYLPTLQLKKSLLQVEVQEARQEMLKMDEEYQKERIKVNGYVALLTDKIAMDPEKVMQVQEIRRRYENIAGVEVPYFESVSFKDFDYGLFDTPLWVDAVVSGLRGLGASKLKVDIASEKKTALEKELREVSIRVNLFEKILIPRAERNIKKIKVFLGDLQLAAVSQAKVAKAKIEEREHEKKLRALK